jgi:hypothetical protein
MDSRQAQWHPVDRPSVFVPFALTPSQSQLLEVGQKLSKLDFMPSLPYSFAEPTFCPH